MHFVTVAEELHFGRAASRLHISQPPLSQSIQRLEQDLGLSLFIRSRRHVELTEAGRRLLEEARLALAQAGNFHFVAQRLARGHIGTLRVGYTLSVPFLPVFMSSVRTLRSESPEVMLELTMTKTNAGIEAVLQSRLDIAVIREFVPVPAPLESVTVATDRFMLILPRTHPLARRKKIAPQQLADEPFLEYPRSQQIGLYDYVRESWLHQKIVPRRTIEASDTLTMMALVAAGLGVSILPSTLQAIRVSELVWRELEDLEDQAAGRIVAVFRRDNHADPVQRRFIRLLGSVGV